MPGNSQTYPAAKLLIIAASCIVAPPATAVEANTTGKLSEPVMNSLVKMVMKYGPVRYANEVNNTGTTFKVVKTSYEKAREDVEKWLENEE